MAISENIVISKQDSVLGNINIASTDDLIDILDLENIFDNGILHSSSDNIESTDNSTLDKHLELADYNLDSKNEFALFIPSKIKYPYIMINKDAYVKAHIMNLFSVVEQGETPFVMQCGDAREEICKVNLTSDTLINLKIIFNTDIFYCISSEHQKVIQPIDLFDTEDIF